MKKHVIIIGGGVAGMSAAHELIKRNFKVTVYELKNLAGGKARSIRVPHSGKEGRNDLPGEHGFRFFPGFYKHVTGTMKEIPYKDGKSAFDNLVDTSFIKMLRFDKEPVALLTRFPLSLDELKKALSNLKNADLELKDNEIAYFAERVWQLMTSCKDRRINEYERMGWWEFLEASSFSEAYQTIFAKGLTRTLVAAKAETASTKTGGDIFVQLLLDMLKIGKSSDRLLNGPTNDVWIDPWLKHLKQQGVEYHYNSRLLRFNCDKKTHKIASITIEKEGMPLTVNADYYISALPVEAMAPHISDDLLFIDPTLENIKELSKSVSWMNGTQFFLKKDVEITSGHGIYIDSPWALTSISQRQFWKDFDFSTIGDGTVQGILSIDISDWDTPGIIYGKTAKECTKEEVIKEVWEQLKRSLNVNGREILKDEYLHEWYIDPDIVFDIPKRNEEPLLVNTINSWDLRPFAYTRVENLLLASDYVKTNTDLATMEGANEAARRAVNCIIDHSKSKVKKCKIYDLHEPRLLFLLRWRDKRRFKAGLPWDGKLPLGFETMERMFVWFTKMIDLLDPVKRR